MSDGLAAGPRMLVVRSRQRRWAVPLDRVVHVGPLERLTRLPNAPAALVGVAAFRGDVVPVHDLATLLGADRDTGGGGGMLLLVRRAGQVVGLVVAEIEEIRSLAVDEAEVLDIDSVPFPAVPGSTAARAAPAAAAERSVAAAELPAERGLEAMLAGQMVWLPLSTVVEVMEGVEAIAVPWADPLVPEVVIRGGAALPVVRVDRLLGKAGVAAASPEGPLIVARWAGGVVAFRVDAVVGIASRSADRAPLGLDALLAALPDAGTAVAARVGGGDAAGDQGRAYLSFVLAGQPCLLPMRAIRTVAAHVRAAGLPGLGRGRGRGTLTGLRAIRGQILPVLDPRSALGLPPDVALEADIVVAAAGLPSFVVPAQTIDGVVRLADAAVHETGRGALIAGVVQVGGRLAWVLAPAGLVE